MSMVDLSNAPKGDLILHADDGRLYRLLGVDYWQLVVPVPVEWNGEGLPPVGVEVEIHNPENYGVIAGAEEFIGAKVKVLSAFTNARGIDIAAVEDCHGACMCFRADMCRPIRTPEQIGAEVRDKDCEEMLSIIKASPWGMTAGPHEVIALLYDASYRKFEIVEN